MAEQSMGPRDFFRKEAAIADLALLACPGAEELCNLVDGHLVRWAREVGMNVDTFIIPSDCPRFQSGDAKGLVKASTRGDDIYIFVDPGNYSVTYNLFGYENHLSPDDHFQNLIRLIQAVSGRAHRISVIFPFAIFLLTGFLRSIPRDYEEAAMIDGCGPFRILTSIIIPMCKPGIVTVCMISAMAAWNEYPVALVMVTDPTKATLPVGLANLYEIQRYATDWGALFAALVLALIPTVILFIVGQKQLVQGLSVGGVKG